jgi:hypothetical protein
VTDECGDVVGIAYMKVKDSENLNFAIPAHFLSELTAAIAAPRAADVMEREGQDRLKSVVATRLGVPQGVDPAQWVQIDPVTQRFFVGLERKELAGPDFFRHVGEGARLGRADNTLPTLLYVSAGACAAASLCACAVSVPLLVTGVGFITAPIGGLGLCASAGLGAGGFLMWSDAIAPELSFDEAKKLAEAHNRRLIVAATADAKRGAAGKRRGDAKSTPTTPPVDDAPPGDPPPPPLETPTPPVDRSAPKEQLAMPF